MDNKKFLEKVAEVLLGRSKADLLETVLVFPNKRPEIFLKKYLKERLEKPFWIPDVRSVDEFITQLSPFTVQDVMVSWFELFEIHKQLEGEKAVLPDEFMSRAPVMLRDFNDVDLAMTDVKELFTFLSKAKAIERWHPDGTSLTGFEKAYLDFYNNLLQYYSMLKNSLTHKQMGTKGMVYRHVAEHIESYNNLPWKQFIFAGFNALTRAEEQIIDGLRKNYAVTFLWDADDYYINPKKYNLPWQEAGRPMNRIFKKLKINTPQWVENNLLESEKNITMVAAPKQISQVKFTGQLLEQWNQNKAGASPVDTAVVLADEKLLIPLLSSLPNDNTVYNVTMGYPLALGNLTRFFVLWIELLVRRSEQKNHTFSTALILSMLQNSTLQYLLHSPETVISKVKNYNTEFVNKNKVLDCFLQADEAVADILFGREANGVVVYKNMMQLLALFKNRIDADIKSTKKTTIPEHSIIQQQVSVLLQVMKKLSLIADANADALSLKVFRKLFVRLVTSSEISLKGEPLNGIQIMGMLETRLLDFNKIIILSANEGMLPKSNASDSFIPFDIRKEFGLPLPDNENAIFAYHFFRLLQRADEVVLVYNAEQGNFGAGEKSRFLLQLEIEAAKANPKLHIGHHYLKLEADIKPDDNTIEIAKSNTILQKLEYLGKQGLSPSALNQYVKCPLQFYFARILKLNAPDEIKSNLEADVFGTIVHEVLEKAYDPFINKPIDPKQLENSMATLDEQINQSLKKNYRGDVNHGKNLLTMQVLRKYLERFLAGEVKKLQKEPRVLVAVERELQADIVLENGKNVLIKGVIDRVDKAGSQLRISDYKTGSVSKKDVNFKEWHQLIDESKYSKAFQTLLYGWMFKKNYPQTGHLVVGLFSLRNLSEGFISPAIQAGNPDNWHLQFESVLRTLLSEIFDSERSFCQTPDNSNCSYCDFKNICNK